MDVSMKELVKSYAQDDDIELVKEMVEALEMELVYIDSARIQAESEERMFDAEDLDLEYERKAQRLKLWRKLLT